MPDRAARRLVTGAGGPSGTVGIIGLGLIGGSLARDLHARGWRVTARDRDAGALDAARAAGIVADGLDPGAVDLLVLAVPVRAAPGALAEVAPGLDPHAVVTDVGSTKASIMDAARRAGLGDRFVGSHPMAGDHRSGWAASRAGLFADRPVWLCGHGAALERVRGLWESTGAVPQVIRPDAHDQLMALVSHLPQVAATAVAATLAGARVGLEDLGPGGRDVTRLAGSDPAMWEDILVDNAANVAPALDRLIAELRELRDALAAGDGGAVRQRFSAGRRWSAGEPAPAHRHRTPPDD